MGMVIGWEKEERWYAGEGDRCEMYVRHVDFVDWHNWTVVLKTRRKLDRKWLMKRMAIGGIEPECENRGTEGRWTTWRLGFSLIGMGFGKCSTREDAVALFEKAMDLFVWFHDGGRGR